VATLGHAIETLLATPFLDFVHPDDREETVVQARQLSVGGEVVSFENRYRCADGSYRWFRWACRGDIDEGLIYGSARDVTRERETLATLDAVNTDLRDHATRLEAANRELESLSYAVSHDLRAPLRAIDGFSHQLEELEGARLSEQGLHALSRVRAATARMSTLMDDLIELSRMARIEMVWQSVDLSGVAASIVASLRRREPDRAVAVTIQPDMAVRGDLRMLRTAMQHLIGNAWKYSGRQADARIEIAASGQGAERTFAVSDNGAGFDMKYAAKLFAPFQRLHTDKQFEGTGMGLATVRRVIRRHGGTIRAQSAPGMGATFTFTLGRVERPAADPEAERVGG
jgi:light-regulated signal transduction histidine kinase (bacteriophytochrome)